MKAPVNRLTKKEILELANWKCPHQHNGLEHYSCWVKYGSLNQRVGFFDIETTNLAANFGIMLSYCIKEAGKKEFYGRALTSTEVLDKLDERLVKDCIRDLEQFDTIVGYYSTKFDIPFVRTRALSYKIDFPFFGSIKHIDCYYMARNKLRLHRNRLENVCDLLGVKGKNHIKPMYWIKALQGDGASLRYIYDHNRRDVVILEKAYDVLKDYTKGTKGSV